MSNNILNPLEKGLLIRLYRSNPDIRLSDFCRANNVSEAAFKTWLKKCDAEGLSGLYRSKKAPSLLPDGVDETEESLRRELIRTRIELERLKKATPGSREKMGRRESSCLYPRRVRDRRGALEGVPCSRALRAVRREPLRLLQVEEEGRRAAERPREGPAPGARPPRRPPLARVPTGARLPQEERWHNGVRGVHTEMLPPPGHARRNQAS